MESTGWPECTSVVTGRFFQLCLKAFRHTSKASPHLSRPLLTAANVLYVDQPIAESWLVDTCLLLNRRSIADINSALVSAQHIVHDTTVGSLMLYAAVEFPWQRKLKLVTAPFYVGIV